MQGGGRAGCPARRARLARAHRSLLAAVDPGRSAPPARWKECSVSKIAYKFSAEIDFLNILQGSDFRVDGQVWAHAMDRVRKIKYVDPNFDDACAIRICTNTANPQLAERRVRSVIAKATRILH